MPSVSGVTGFGGIVLTAATLHTDISVKRHACEYVNALLVQGLLEVPGIVKGADPTRNLSYMMIGAQDMEPFYEPSQNAGYEWPEALVTLAKAVKDRPW